MTPGSFDALAFATFIKLKTCSIPKDNHFIPKFGNHGLFLSFQTNITIFTTNICKNVYPVCTVLGFEPITFSSITTRPGLLAKIKTIIPKFGNLTASRSSKDIVITCALDNKKSVLITYLISKPKRTYLLCFDRYDR